MTYELTSTTATCPACLGTDARLLYRVNASTAAQHYVLREVEPERHDALREHIAALWGQPTCALTQCARCDLVFADPYVAGDARFYTLAYERTGYPTDRWEFGLTLDALRQQDGAAAYRVLELGAGDGAFVRRLAPSLVAKDHIVTTEYSDYGREQIGAYGVECLAQDVRTLSTERFGARFDAVCFFQVLEHLDDLDTLFAALDALTKPEAHLFISVPNDRRTTFNEHHGSLLDMPPNHIGRWTLASFEALADRLGWRVVRHAVQDEAYAAKVKQHVLYRYTRKRQETGSLANRAEQVRPGPARQVLRAAIAGLYAAGALPTVLPKLRARDLGGSQWVHLQKT